MMVMLVKAYSILPMGSRFKGPSESMQGSSSFSPPRLVFAVQQTKLCSGSVAQRKQPKQGRCLKVRRLSGNGATRPILIDPNILRTERKSVVVVARRILEDEEGPSLNRNEVVELLSDAVQTLLKPENQRHLRKQLEKKSQQRVHQHQREIPVQQPSSEEDQWSSLANCRQDLEEERDAAETTGDTADARRHPPPDQESVMRPTSVAKSSTILMTELEKSERESRSIENVRFSSESVDGKKDSSSLTGIRRLKVLDVHSYVHNALRESALRSWLKSRAIEE